MTSLQIKDKYFKTPISLLVQNHFLKKKQVHPQAETITDNLSPKIKQYPVFQLNKTNPFILWNEIDRAMQSTSHAYITAFTYININTNGEKIKSPTQS